MPGWQETDARCVEWVVYSEFDGLLMPRFGTDVSKLTNVGNERRKSFCCGDNCQVDHRGLRAVGEDNRGCGSLVIGQKFWVEGYLERAFRIGLDHLWCCDFGVTTSCVNPVDVEWVFAYVSCCQGSCYGPFPFGERSEVNLLLCQDELGCGCLPVVDEENNKPKD